MNQPQSCSFEAPLYIHPAHHQERHTKREKKIVRRRRAKWTPTDTFNNKQSYISQWSRWYLVGDMERGAQFSEEQFPEASLREELEIWRDLLVSVGGWREDWRTKSSKRRDGRWVGREDWGMYQFSEEQLRWEGDGACFAVMVVSVGWWRDGLMACREKNEREKVRRGDGRRVASAHVSCAEGKWFLLRWNGLGGRTKSSTGGKFKEEQLVCLSVAVVCLQRSLLVMGKKEQKGNGWQRDLVTKQLL